MKTVRLTMAQALVRFLENQYIEVDGEQSRFVRGVFIIPGHGNVVGLGQALSQEAKHLEIWHGQNEQGMAQAAVAFAKQMKRKQICVATSSVGPGAANMVTACGTATANNIPLLVLPGDVYACRQPDPVLQQVEQTNNLSISTNDALPRPSAATGTASSAGAADERHDLRFPGADGPRQHRRRLHRHASGRGGRGL